MKLLQFCKKKNDFDVDHIARKRELLHSSFPARLSSGLKRVLPILKGYSWNYQSFFIVLVPWVKVKDNWSFCFYLCCAFQQKKGRRSHLVTFYLDHELSLLRLVCRQDVRENREKKWPYDILGARNSCTLLAPKILRGLSRCFLCVTHNRPSERRREYW